jgi:hypothetical protein
MNTTQISKADRVILTIVRDLDSRAAKATGTERERLERAAAHCRQGDVAKRLRKQGVTV